MSNDLIERLHTITSNGCNPYSACHEAAAELAHLRAEVERLRGVLRKRTGKADRADERADKAEAALADERAHADALAETLYGIDGLQEIDCEMRDTAVQQHRARRQG